MQFTFYCWPFGLFVTFHCYKQHWISCHSWYVLVCIFDYIPRKVFMWVKLLSQTVYILKAGILRFPWLGFSVVAQFPRLYSYSPGTWIGTKQERGNSLVELMNDDNLWLSSEEYCLLHVKSLLILQDSHFLGSIIETLDKFWLFSFKLIMSYGWQAGEEKPICEWQIIREVEKWSFIRLWRIYSVWQHSKHRNMLPEKDAENNFTG